MKILLGITGGIAAYKACELTSLAIKAGHEVRVCMSPNAERFVGALSLEALSGHPVLTDTFQGAAEGAIDHIEWAKWADAVCVAPLTANVLGKLACGIADDALTTVLMAIPRRTPIVLAPAMNTEMWLNPVVQRNIGWLEELGRYKMIAPVEKRLACGDHGPGGLAEPSDLLAAIESSSASLRAC
ncbi:MAG: flavoprotein [Myxococcota bacterium]|nr:flavoprotein [Myxococcota bacterium]